MQAYTNNRPMNSQVLKAAADMMRDQTEDFLHQIKEHEQKNGKSPSVTRRKNYYLQLLRFFDLAEDTAQREYIKGLDVARRENEPNRWNREEYRAAHAFKVINNNKKLY